MAETLFIRLGSQAQDIIHWLVLNTSNQEIIASGEINNAEQLSSLTDKAKQRDLKVLVPSCDVVLKSLTVPGKSQRAIRLATPYMLEDELAQDVDQLFFAYADLPKNSQGNNCFVAIVERAQLALWQLWLNNADLTTKVMLPDVLAMPLGSSLNENVNVGKNVDKSADENSDKKTTKWSAITLGSANNEQILIRQGLWQGFTVDHAAWQFIAKTLSKQDKQESQQEVATEIEAYSALPHSDELTLNNLPEELPLALLAKHSKSTSFNLLQGEYKVKDQHSTVLVHWLWVAGIAACAVLLNLGYKSAELWQLNAKQAAVEQQIINTYKKAFPRVKRVRISTIKSQLNQKIAQLGGLSDSEGFLSMLSKAQPAFAKVPALKAESLKFDGKRQELRLQAVANDYQPFEQLKSALETVNLQVKQGAQSNQGEQVSGSFTITNKKQSKIKSGGRS